MRPRFILALLAFIVVSSAYHARAQDVVESRPAEPRVPLAQSAVAFDADGNEALAATLLTQDLAGLPDAPVKNTRIVIRNRSQFFYTYVQGWATFYDERGTRCGEGLWKLEAFAPDEQVEVDTPGTRIVCRPASWRIVATTLLTRTTDVAKPGSASASPASEGSINAAEGAAITGVTRNPPLEINVNGRTIPIQLDKPLEIVVGTERVRIVVQRAP